MIWAEYNRQLNRRRWLRTLRITLWVVLFAGVAACGFMVAEYYNDLDRQYVRALEQMRDSHEREQVALRRELVNLQVAQNVGEQSGAELRDNIKTLRDEQAQLREELVFYRSLIAPNKLTEGLQVASFELFERRSGVFTYHLLLTQVTSQRSRISGRVTLQVAGQQAGQAQVLPLTDLSEIDGYPLRYRFRYFQDLKGQIDLPQGFTPEQVQIVVTGKGRSNIELAVAWDDALAAGSG